jgi:predicted phosphodiesterase
MRVFGLSDIHVDYEANAKWLNGISSGEYRDDVLILAGDVTDSHALLAWCLGFLERRFRKVAYIPGNHDLWIIRDRSCATSFERLERIRSLAADCGVAMETIRLNGLSVVPLYGWYDYSFGQPSARLREVWMDYYACRWPPGVGSHEVTSRLIELNESTLDVRNGFVISFSHFLPRKDLVRGYGSSSFLLYPVLGTTRLEQQIRRLRPNVHLYGHSHINGEHLIDGIRYVNNAFGYPHETANKRLACLWHG